MLRPFTLLSLLCAFAFAGGNDISVPEGYGISLPRGAQVMGYDADVVFAQGKLEGHGGATIVEAQADAQNAPPNGYQEALAVQAGRSYAVKTRDGSYYRVDVVSCGKKALVARIALLLEPASTPQAERPPGPQAGAPQPPAGPDLSVVQGHTERAMAAARGGDLDAAIEALTAAIEALRALRGQAPPVKKEEPKPPDGPRLEGLYWWFEGTDQEKYTFHKDGHYEHEVISVPGGVYHRASDRGTYQIDGKTLVLRQERAANADNTFGGRSEGQTGGANSEEKVERRAFEDLGGGKLRIEGKEYKLRTW